MEKEFLHGVEWDNNNGNNQGVNGSEFIPKRDFSSESKRKIVSNIDKFGFDADNVYLPYKSYRYGYDGKIKLISLLRSIGAVSNSRAGVMTAQMYDDFEDLKLSLSDIENILNRGSFLPIKNPTPSSADGVIDAHVDTLRDDGVYKVNATVANGYPTYGSYPFYTEITADLRVTKHLYWSLQELTYYAGNIAGNIEDSQRHEKWVRWVDNSSGEIGMWRRVSADLSYQKFLNTNDKSLVGAINEMLQKINSVYGGGDVLEPWDINRCSTKVAFNAIGGNGYGTAFRIYLHKASKFSKLRLSVPSSGYSPPQIRIAIFNGTLGTVGNLRFESEKIQLTNGLNTIDIGNLELNEGIYNIRIISSSNNTIFNGITESFLFATGANGAYSYNTALASVLDLPAHNDRWSTNWTTTSGDGTPTAVGRIWFRLF